MKNILFAFMCLTVGIQTFAAPAKSTKKKPASFSETQPSHTTPQRSSQSAFDDHRLGASLGLGMNDGHFGFGAGFRAEVPVQMDAAKIWVGAETGIYRFSYSQSYLTTSYDASVMAIPIAATGMYQFQLNNTNVTPYGRASLGIDVAIAKASTTIAGVSASDTSVKFHLVLEPGIEFSENRFFAALPFGTMAGGFLLFPTFGMHF